MNHLGDSHTTLKNLTSLRITAKFVVRKLTLSCTADGDNAATVMLHCTLEFVFIFLLYVNDITHEFGRRGVGGRWFLAFLHQFLHLKEFHIQTSKLELSTYTYMLVAQATGTSEF